MKKNSEKNEFSIRLCPAVLKKDKMEYIVQKCTEIGVLEFCPLLTSRTEKANLNMERLNKIIREAAEQSEKNYLPSLMEITSLEKFVNENETNQNMFYLDMKAPLIDVSKIIDEIKNNETKDTLSKITIFIGPEGGWNDADRKTFSEKSVKPVSLGDTVLRAETASIAVSSLFLLGR